MNESVLAHMNSTSWCALRLCYYHLGIEGLSVQSVHRQIHKNTMDDSEDYDLVKMIYI